MILHDQSLLPTAPSVPVGMTWTITEDTTWEVPATGSYQIEMHGGGGGGVSVLFTRNTYKAAAASGGGSGEVYLQTLNKQQKIPVIIGAGGDSAEGQNQNISAGTGGTTQFGTLSLAGGTGGQARSSNMSVYRGSANGSIAEDGETKEFGGTATGGNGNKNNAIDTHGDGGSAIASSSLEAYPGKPGAVIVTYLG